MLYVVLSAVYMVIRNADEQLKLLHIGILHLAYLLINVVFLMMMAVTFSRSFFLLVSLQIAFDSAVHCLQTLRTL